jgi:hypothetical protein
MGQAKASPYKAHQGQSPCLVWTNLRGAGLWERPVYNEQNEGWSHDLVENKAAPFYPTIFVKTSSLVLWVGTEGAEPLPIADCRPSIENFGTED